MQWIPTVSTAVSVVNILLAVYNLRLLVLASRYHSMARALLAGAWRLRDWIAPAIAEPHHGVRLRLVRGRHGE